MCDVCVLFGFSWECHDLFYPNSRGITLIQELVFFYLHPILVCDYIQVTEKKSGTISEGECKLKGELFFFIFFLGGGLVRRNPLTTFVRTLEGTFPQHYCVFLNLGSFGSVELLVTNDFNTFVFHRCYPP